METKEKRNKQAKSTTNGTLKDRMGRWIHRSPKLEKFVDNTSYFIKHPDKFTERVNEIYNQATSRGEYKTLAEFGSKFQSAFRMAKLTISGEYTGIPKGQLFAGLAALVYVISPIDLIPDALPFLGFVDDAALLLWLVRNASEQIDRFEQWEQAQGTASVNPAY
jgi:uncharacterized membrane protein YkvA (DUF1232 family)